VECLLRYRGKNYTAQEVQCVRELIARHPSLSRRRLSEQLCRDWNWVQPNGQLRSMVCRGLIVSVKGGAIYAKRGRWLRWEDDT
jgi:hypothetical protein